MKIIIRADEKMKQALLTQGVSDAAAVHWVEDWSLEGEADAVIDLLYQPSDMPALSRFSSEIVLINLVDGTLTGVPKNFIRVNGWPGFLERSVLEASAIDNSIMIAAEQVAALFKRSIEWVPDRPGFISAGVVAMIINEAFFALQEKISTREEIDTAMRLGTNYPFGPFEWCDLIGIDKIYSLLQELAKSNDRYQPCPLIKGALQR